MSVTGIRYREADFSEERWAVTMASLLEQISPTVPRRKEEVAWRLALAARYRKTTIKVEEDQA